MTTTSAVAFSHSTQESDAGRLVGFEKREPRGASFKAAALACAAMAGLALAGCGSTNLLGDSTSDVTSATAVAPTQAPTAPPVVSQSRVAIAPVMGAPEAVSTQVAGQLGGALDRQRVRVAQASEKPDYTLRGYMVATRERAGTKVSYIFDLTDGAGKRVNRIQGEEIAQGGTAANPWAALTPEMSQRITDKTATSLAATLASLTGSSGGATAASAPPVGVGASRSPQADAAMAPASPPPSPAGQTTGSVVAMSNAPTALIPAVTGAPGDGNTSLAAAMRSELQRSGIGSASSGQGAYAVAGKVSVGPVKDGKQPIKIDWRVTDPNGALLATVSQNNEIQAGSLDGAWGGIASDAAQGAASRIKQLIDENRAAGASRGGSAQATPRSRG